MIKRRAAFAIIAIVGLVLLLLGGFVFTSNELKTVSGICFGLGSAMSVLGIGYLVDSFVISATEGEKIKRFKAIEVNDERNTRIREKSGYKVSKIMNYIIMVLVLALAFMNENVIIIIMVASLLLIEFILVIVFSNYYSKKL